MDPIRFSLQIRRRACRRLPLRGEERKRSEKRRRKREREGEYPASWIRFVHQIESVELRITDEWLNSKLITSCLFLPLFSPSVPLSHTLSPHSLFCLSISSHQSLPSLFVSLRYLLLTVTVLMKFELAPSQRPRKTRPKTYKL